MQDCYSSCGPLANISYPFRLNQSPKTCGLPDPMFEFTCENNRTVWSFFSNRYYVLNISSFSYERGMIRLLDSLLPAKNCSSLLSYNYGSYSDFSNLEQSLYFPFSPGQVVYVNCSVPVEDPAYVPVTPCNRSSSPHTPYLYAIMNNSMSITRLNTSCKVVMKIPASFGDRENATSYHEIEIAAYYMFYKDMDIGRASFYGYFVEHKPAQLKLAVGPAEQCHNPIKITSKVGL
ncbi:hypothetical protein MRB53_030773 [Persea americana]|uniref:Uncharacterized protein n=1 Tax=Persea americana TaxID=3435 RepID=A0ACC2KMR1_PERAE|nr:hypothetical protein MRB53_030773 [Persea americana]